MSSILISGVAQLSVHLCIETANLNSDGQTKRSKYGEMVAGPFITGRFITGRFNTVGSSRGRFITRSIQHRSIHHKHCYIQL